MYIYIDRYIRPYDICLTYQHTHDNAQVAHSCGAKLDRLLLPSWLPANMVTIYLVEFICALYQQHTSTYSFHNNEKLRSEVIISEGFVVEDTVYICKIVCLPPYCQIISFFFICLVNCFNQFFNSFIALFLKRFMHTEEYK